MRIITAIRFSTLWVRALDASHERRPGDAIRLVELMKGVGPLRPNHLAFLGTMHVLTRDSLKGRKAFLEAERATRDAKDAGGRYVNAYARIYLKAMDTQEPLQRMIDEAMTIKCRSSLKRALPLARVEQFA